MSAAASLHAYAIACMLTHGSLDLIRDRAQSFPPFRYESDRRACRADSHPVSLWTAITQITSSAHPDDRPYSAFALRLILRMAAIGENKYCLLHQSIWAAVALRP